MVVVLAALAAYNWRSPGLHWYGVALAGVLAVFILILFAAFAIIPSLIFRREPKFRDDYSLAFSPEGIHFRTAHIDSQLQLSLYSRALVDAKSYVLYHGSRSFTVIPKRVLQSAEQQEAFEQLLGQKVPQIIRRNR
jgi:hypothetical protein